MCYLPYNRCVHSGALSCEPFVLAAPGCAQWAGEPLAGVDNRFAEVRILIFDLDGTLIDSKLDLAHAVNATLEHMKREPLSHETIYSYVGNGAPMLVRRALGESASDEGQRNLFCIPEGYYRAHARQHGTAYPGVREGIALLEQHPMAVLTNKPVHFSRAILDGLGLLRYFRYVYGGNSFEKKKPHPMGTETLLRELGAAPREAMIVGDSDVDVRTARNAGT